MGIQKHESQIAFEKEVGTPFLKYKEILKERGSLINVKGEMLRYDDATIFAEQDRMKQRLRENLGKKLSIIRSHSKRGLNTPKPELILGKDLFIESSIATEEVLKKTLQKNLISPEGIQHVTEKSTLAALFLDDATALDNFNTITHSVHAFKNYILLLQETNPVLALLIAKRHLDKGAPSLELKKRSIDLFLQSILNKEKATLETSVKSEDLAEDAKVSDYAAHKGEQGHTKQQATA